MKRFILKSIVLLSAAIFLATPLQAERKPGHLFPPEKIDILEKPREWQKPEEVLEFLELREGDVVADIGAGAGYFALLFAPKVGAKGIVYAEEIQKEMVDYMKKKIDSLGIQNVKVVLGEPTDPRLPKGSLNLAFLGNVYHEVENPTALLKNIYSELKPEGKLAIIDWDPYRESPIGPPTEERVPEDEVIEEAENAGFELYGMRALTYHYFFIFKKK